MLHLLNHLKNVLGQSVTNTGLKALSLPKKWNYGSSELESYYSTYQSENVRPDLRVDMFLFLWGNIHPFFTLNFSQ